VLTKCPHRLDDIQDGSPSRRGYPSSHMVFGISQTVNSATYAYAKCLENVMKLSKAAAEAFSSNLKKTIPRDDYP
jgi:geranylgeranyl pyrophosphate synthase